GATRSFPPPALCECRHHRFASPSIGVRRLRSLWCPKANVRFGSEADMEAPPRNVRFTPESGHAQGLRGALSLDRPRAPRIGGVASQPKRPQARGLFAHRMQFGLVLGHCLLGPTQLLFFFEQRLGTAVCLVGIHAQYETPCKSPGEDLDPPVTHCVWIKLR